MRQHKHYWRIVGSGAIFIWFDCVKCHREMNVVRDELWGQTNNASHLEV